MRPVGLASVALVFLLAACGAEETAAPEKAPEDVSEDKSQEVEALDALETVELSTPREDDEADGEEATDLGQDPGIDTDALLAAIRAQDEAALKNIEPVQSAPTITVMRGLDKVTARVMPLEVHEGQEVRFGTLAITARTCTSRPPEETPETFAYLEIDDVKNNDERTRVFTGWMPASSPALNPLEHPVYDVWVIDCKTVDGGAPGSSE